MDDDDPPPCPSCETPLAPKGAKLAPHTTPADWDYLTEIYYGCPACNRLWRDRLDGSPLILVARPVQ